jgi:hypothetical protein
MTPHDICYGLRNLAVGDDEQTRIGDCIDELSPNATLRTAVQALCDLGEWDTAYRVALRYEIEYLGLSRNNMLEAIATFIVDWDEACSDGTDDPDNGSDVTADELIAELDALHMNFPTR